MNLIEYADREMMMMSLARKLAGELGETLRASGRATFCVPGGTTPGPVFDMMSAVDMDWANVFVLLGDERWVPEDHPRSNTRLVRKHLLRDKAAAAVLVPLHADTPTPEEAMEALTEGLLPHLPISVLLLGMGGDMHIASLFPRADRLKEALSSDAPVLMAMRADGVDEPRLTLTAPVLKAATRIHLLITGPEKRAALERAEKLSAEEAPVQVVLSEATVHWAE